jgi:hypothetical protein
MDWLVFWQCFIAVLALSFIALIFLAIASGASATKHKRRLELIEARRLHVQVSEGAVTVSAGGDQDPRMAAEAALQTFNERSL